MVTVTIDGHEVGVAEGTNLVEAAGKVGIEIPTYCYHPGLSVAGQCRICFVEVEGAPRLVTACSTPVRDGMVVLTSSERVREARAAVMEFLLENHPLDCPVCDQAGECFLQDYSVDHGLDTTHMVDERRTYPGMERRQIGPHVVQNQNRCIHCTRCIRFTAEISETHDLTMKSRGNHSYIDTFGGGPLDNPWSACVADVCPVGALTVKEFRFRARVWHLEDTDSVCPGCSIGCAIRIGHHKEVVHRFLPRSNPEINGWWMCDYGRFLAEDQNTRDIERPMLSSGGDLTPVGWKQAVRSLADLVTGTGPRARVVLSASLSNETLYLAKRVLVDHLGLDAVVPVFSGDTRRIKNARGEWIERVDAHPNTTGARLLGLRTADKPELEALITDGYGPLVFLDARAHPWLDGDDMARLVKGRRVAVCARVHTALTRQAQLVLPSAAWVETEGTYTSSTGRVQLARRAFFPHGQARQVWEMMADLAGELGMDWGRPPSSRAIFEELVGEVPAFAGMAYRRLEVEPGMPALEEVPHVG